MGGKVERGREKGREEKERRERRERWNKPSLVVEVGLVTLHLITSLQFYNDMSVFGCGLVVSIIIIIIWQL